MHCRPACTLLLLGLLAASVASVRGDEHTPLASLLSARHLTAQASTTCSLQMEIDFAGNDLANIPAAAASDCCAQCSALVGCRAFTWTDFNGGTCWLKSQKGTSVVAKTGAQSAEVVAPSLTSLPLPLPSPPSVVTSCSIEAGVDYVNNDIANVPATVATDCCDKCRATAGCGAFTWTDWNGGTCWLKSGKGATKATAGAYSAVVGAAYGGSVTQAPTPLTPMVTATMPPPSTGGTCPYVEQNTDYTGADIANVPGAGATDCCAKCSQRAGCGAFTWTNWNGGTCWLKSERGSAKELAGGISAVLTASSPTPLPLPQTPSPTPSLTSTPAVPAVGACPVVEENTDFTGPDLANVAGNGASDCCAKCRQRSDCRAFTWTNWNGGTCWLKSAKGSATPMPGAVSAVIAPSSVPVAPPSATPSPASAMPMSPATTHIQPRLRSGAIPLRSVNLGGWLVGENWMSLNSTAWTDAGDAAAFGEYTTMQRLGKTKGTAQFEQHRATWITETDIQQIAAAGMNAVRVPVGFWIVNDDPSAVATDISRVYAAGALKYLDKLINDWAVKYNLAVMLSLHAHQGSQNGYDHSAPQTFGAVTWSNSQANVDNSLQFSTFLAARYQNSVAFLGMNLMNEPMFPTDLTVVQAYYEEAYRRIRATGNDCVLVTSPLLWNQFPPTMMDYMHGPAFTNVWHEFHVYFRWTLEGKTETQILDTAKPYRSWNLDPWTGNPLLLGEWSLAGPDSAPFQDKEQLKQYAAIQLQNYEGARAGWAFWSWRHDEEATKISGWSLRQLLREGIFTIPTV